MFTLLIIAEMLRISFAVFQTTQQCGPLICACNARVLSNISTLFNNASPCRLNLIKSFRHAYMLFVFLSQMIEGIL